MTTRQEHANRSGKPRVLMICTRPYTSSEDGRERIMAFILETLSNHGDVRVFRVYSLLENWTPLRFLSSIRAAITGLVRAKPVPLQCLLFFNPRYVEQLYTAIEEFKPNTVYFDGVRAGVYTLALRKRYPTLRFVCDFDDLMSRRMATLAEVGQPIALGHLKKFIPRWLERHVQRLLQGPLSRAIISYEKIALKKTERMIADCSDEIVLVSAVESELLREQAPSASIRAIPPILPSIHTAITEQPIRRFVFVGSDRVVHNRLTIEYLVNLWRTLKPPISLHLFGGQHGAYADVPGVIAEGFVENIAEAYVPGSVLLTPSLVRGGVKTKVLEALAFGVVPVGTSITFEGIQAECAPLILSDTELRNLVLSPNAWSSRLFSGGSAVARQVTKTHSAERIAQSWLKAIWPNHAEQSRAGENPPSAITRALNAQRST